jgi:hypothetical protein
MFLFRLGFLAMVFLLVFAPRAGEAAMLYMDPNQGEVFRGDYQTVSIRLNVDPEECINAVDATITYSDNIEAIDTSRGSSILSIWLEEPVINRENRTITFAGGIPNGYCGRIAGDPRLTNNLVDIIFMSPGMRVGAAASGDVAMIDFADTTRVLLNDGFGTEANRSLYGAAFNLSRNPGPQQSNDWLDVISLDEAPPEEFTITLSRNETAFDGRYFIVFNTTDKQSGIAYYEVIEEPIEQLNLFMWGGVDAPWVRAESPYILKDQSLNSVIRVRAIDKAGNEYVASLVPDETQRSISQETLISYIVLGVVGFIVLVVAVIICHQWRKRRARKVAQDIDDDEDESYE